MTSSPIRQAHHERELGHEVVGYALLAHPTNGLAIISIINEHAPLHPFRVSVNSATKNPDVGLVVS